MDKNLFKLNATLMRSIGMYRPDPKWTVIRKIGYYLCMLIWMVCLCGGVLFNIQGIIWGEGNGKISDIAFNIINIGLFGSVLLRTFYFAKDNTKIDYLSKRFEREFVKSTTFSFKPVTMDFIKTVNHWLIIGWTAYVLLAGFLMTVGPVLKTPKELPFKIYTSYDLNDPFYYTLTLLAESVAINMMLMSHGNMDMLNAAFMLLTSGQIEILTSDFANIVHDALRRNQCSETEILDFMSNEDVVNSIKLKGNNKIELILQTDSYKNDLRDNLIYCIKRHQHLLEFIDEYQSFISPYLLVEVNFNFGYLIFTLFTFVNVDNNSMYAPMSMYLSGCIAQIFLVMYLGDRLSSSIDDLRDQFYDMPWYVCNLHFLKNFKIIQLRMSKPVSIYAGKLIFVSLDTFLEYMKKVFSFFTMLRQVNNAE